MQISGIYSSCPGLLFGPDSYMWAQWFRRRNWETPANALYILVPDSIFSASNERCTLAETAILWRLTTVFWDGRFGQPGEIAGPVHLFDGHGAAKTSWRVHSSLFPLFEPHPLKPRRSLRRRKARWKRRWVNRSGMWPDRRRFRRLAGERWGMLCGPIG